MSHISISHPGDPAGLEPVVLPPPFVALKKVDALEGSDPSSTLLLKSLRQFIKKNEFHELARLRGSAAAEAADFFDTVRGPDSTIVSSCN